MPDCSQQMEGSESFLLVSSQEVSLREMGPDWAPQYETDMHKLEWSEQEAANTPVGPQYVRSGFA